MNRYDVTAFARENVDMTGFTILSSDQNYFVYQSFLSLSCITARGRVGIL
jgi:hypothetical protein